MKWQTIISLSMLFTTTVHAHWVYFEACGLQDPKEVGPLRLGRTQPAPSYGPYWIWVPAVAYVTGATEKIHVPPDPHCTIINVQSQRVLVIGSVDEVMAKLRRAKR